MSWRCLENVAQDMSCRCLGIYKTSWEALAVSWHAYWKCLDISPCFKTTHVWRCLEINVLECFNTSWKCLEVHIENVLRHVLRHLKMYLETSWDKCLGVSWSCCPLRHVLDASRHIEFVQNIFKMSWSVWRHVEATCHEMFGPLLRHSEKCIEMSWRYCD